MQLATCPPMVDPAPPWAQPAPPPWLVVEIDTARCARVRELACRSERAAKNLAIERSELRPWAEERVLAPSGAILGWAVNGRWSEARS